jgi:hypothetical protein
MSQKRCLWKTRFLIVLLGASFFALVALSPISVLAQVEGLESAGGAAGFDTGRSVFEIIGIVINVFLGTLGVIFLILTIYAGFLWMTAGGNDAQIGKAKKILVNAVIGLIITLSAYAIVTFIFNALEDAGLINQGQVSDSSEPLSGSLGAGAISDHYPGRGQVDVPRNTKILVTFKSAMNIESFIDGYDDGDTPLDVSDDVIASALEFSNIKIYKTADGIDEALSGNDVSVSFTDDLKTFVFSPPILGSATEDTNYSVYLDDAIRDSEGDSVLNAGGYLWTFTVSTELDLTPPEVKNVIPRNVGTYDRNIIVQIDFTEAIDPTSSTGSTLDGFENIQVSDEVTGVVSGSYAVSNQYKTITFTTFDACGTNSCGETIYCLPGNANFDSTVFAATPGNEPPQVDIFPYDGIVDVAANSLDGNGDGVAGDNYEWKFSTTDDVNLSSPEIDSISPNINGEDVDLDQDVIVTFGCENSIDSSTCDSVLMSSTVNSDNITLASKPVHEMWYALTKDDFGPEPTEEDPDPAPEGTEVTVKHGIFFESTDEQAYTYRAGVTQGMRNQYQNCYVPAQGPDAFGGRCGVNESQPFCCAGNPSSVACP